jgi:hypothetical protein
VAITASSILAVLSSALGLCKPPRRLAIIGLAVGATELYLLWLVASSH